MLLCTCCTRGIQHLRPNTVGQNVRPHFRRLAWPLHANTPSSKTLANSPAHIIRITIRTIKVMRTTLGSNIPIVGEMSEKSCWVVPRANRVARDQTRLRAESGVFIELLRAVASLDVEHEVAVANVAAGGVVGLEGDAAAVAETGADCPAGGFLESCSAGGRDDLSVYCRAVMGEVAGVVAWCGGTE